MSVRCSVLGHSYGDSEVEREREERGSEVVVTVRELQTCSRCGDTKLVSENTEVTSMPGEDADAAASGESPATGEGTPDAGPGEGEPDEAAEAGASDDAEIVDGADAPDGTPADAATGTGEAGSDAGEKPAPLADAAAGEDPTGEEVPEVDPEEIIQSVEDGADGAGGSEEGGEIIDGEDGEAGRAPGEWPAAEDANPPEGAERPPEEWPDVEGRDEGFDAEPADGEPADVEFGGGLAPETAGEDVSDSGDAVASEDPAAGAGGAADTAEGSPARDVLAGDTGFTSAGEAPDPNSRSASDPASELFCPECGHSALTERTSLRAGDICPECKVGYIAERDR